MADKSKLRRGFDAAQSAFEEKAKSYKKFVPNFFMPKKSKRTVIFLSKTPVMFEQHVVPVIRNGQKRFDNVTSPQTFDVKARDPLKDAGSNTQLIAYFTIIDKSSWTDQKGREHKNEKKLLGLKSQAFEVVRRRAEDLAAKDKSLKFAVFTTERGSSSKEPSTGIDWQYVKHISKKKALALLKAGAQDGDDVTLDEFDYEEVMAPPSKDELKALARRFARANGAEDEDEDEEDTDVDEDDDDEVEEEEDEDIEDDVAPSKSKKRKAKKTAAKKSKKKRASDDDDEDEEEDEEYEADEESVDYEDEDEEEEEDEEDEDDE